jgi:hypothetical protein
MQINLYARNEYTPHYASLRNYNSLTLSLIALTRYFYIKKRYEKTRFINQ